MRTRLHLLATTLFLAIAPAASGVDGESLDSLVDRALELVDGPRARLMILGTFHFDDAGLDDYKPQHEVAIDSERRQRELAELIEDLARFAPTKVAVEWPKSSRARVQALYDEYRRGELDPDPNEVVQVGFRLARRLGPMTKLRPSASCLTVSRNLGCLRTPAGWPVGGTGTHRQLHPELGS